MSKNIFVWLIVGVLLFTLFAATTTLWSADIKSFQQTAFTPSNKSSKVKAENCAIFMRILSAVLRFTLHLSTSLRVPLKEILPKDAGASPYPSLKSSRFVTASTPAAEQAKISKFSINQIKVNMQMRGTVTTHKTVDNSIEVTPADDSGA